jgi:predicted DNA-binding transcriptional regulator AlpA
MNTDPIHNSQVAAEAVAVEPTALALLRPEEVARLLGISLARLQAWRRKGVGPAFIAYPRGVRYRLDDVRSWLDEQTKNKGCRND